jgi:hypothetical protein
VAIDLTINNAKDSPVHDDGGGIIDGLPELGLNRATLRHLQQGLALRTLWYMGKLTRHFSGGSGRWRDRARAGLLL